MENLVGINGSFHIENNSLLVDFDELTGLTYIGADLVIINNQGLTNLEGFENLNIVGSIFIENNNSLSNLSIMHNLLEIEGDLIIRENPSLAEIAGFENVMNITGHLEIEENNSLITISGFDWLESIQGNFSLRWNPELISISGFTSLTNIFHHLLIWNNTNLTSIGNLNSLSTVEGSIYILNNLNLVSLEGLDNIMPGTIDNLGIGGNEMLSDCSVQSICNYLASPNGVVNINKNAAGCQSIDEILIACLVEIDESSEENFFSVFPNPVSNGLTINTFNPLIDQTKIVLTDVHGKTVLEQSITEATTWVDVHFLSRGVYFLQLLNTAANRVEKIIKE